MGPCDSYDGAWRFFRFIRAVLLGGAQDRDANRELPAVPGEDVRDGEYDDIFKFTCTLLGCTIDGFVLSTGI